MLVCLLRHGNMMLPVELYYTVLPTNNILRFTEYCYYPPALTMEKFMCYLTYSLCKHCVLARLVLLCLHLLSVLLRVKINSLMILPHFLAVLSFSFFFSCLALLVSHQPSLLHLIRSMDGITVITWRAAVGAVL